MTPDDEGQEPEDQDEDSSGEATEPPKPPKKPPPSDAQRKALRRARRIRNKMDEAFDEDPDLDGHIKAMVAVDQSQREHRISYSADWLTDKGGPADQVIELLKETYNSLTSIVASAHPFLQSFAPVNSIEIVFYAPDQEIEEARLRSEYLGEDAGTDALSDTGLAVLALGDVISGADAAEVASKARGISQKATDGLHDLVRVLADAEIKMTVQRAAPEGVEPEPIVLDHERSRQILAQLDASAEIPATTVSVYGVLEGANRRGMGSFEIQTDSDTGLDPIFGPRRKPGSVMKGSLTPGARREIQRDGLWGWHVHARIQVVRRREGSKTVIHALRLMKVELRYPKSEQDTTVTEG